MSFLFCKGFVHLITIRNDQAMKENSANLHGGKRQDPVQNYTLGIKNTTNNRKGNLNQEFRPRSPDNSLKKSKLSFYSWTRFMISARWYRSLRKTNKKSEHAPNKTTSHAINLQKSFLCYKSRRCVLIYHKRENFISRKFTLTSFYIKNYKKITFVYITSKRRNAVGDKTG